MAEFEIYSSPTRSPHPPYPIALSPAPSDADFYRRKAERFEQDVIAMGDELNRARLRLRRAEDFEIKYNVLLGEKAQADDEATRREREIIDLRTRNEQQILTIAQKQERSQNGAKDYEALLAQAALWRDRANQAEERALLTSAEAEEKASLRVQTEVARIKRNFIETEEEYKFQLARLNKQLQERSASDSSSFEKQERGRKQKEAQIQRLQRVVAQGREDFLAMVQEKNKEMEQLRAKFQGLFHAQLGQLQKNMGQQDQRFNAQLHSLRTVIEVKNTEISNLQEELKEALQQYSRERDELSLQIKLLKEKIYERERLNEEELFNMKQRLTSLHALDIQAQRTHYEALLDALRQERAELENLLADRDARVAFQLKEFQRARNELREVVADRERTIQDLRQLHGQHAVSSSGEANTMQVSLAKLTSEKEALLSEHQANTAFLNQQIQKLTASNDLKNNQIRELHEYTALLKKEHFESLRELELRWKAERRDREAQREKERDLRQKVEEDFREKEKLWRNRERELERDFEKERREKNKTALLVDKLQKEIDRLFKHNGQLEEQLKAEMGRIQKTVIFSGDSKRQLTGQLERQRAELQARKRLQVEQARKEFELQVTRLTHQNQKLQNELTTKRIEYENLEQEFRKISSQYKNIQKINKEKLADYHKKMATINSEILLTQNLYQSFIDAKTRVIKKD